MKKKVSVITVNYNNLKGLERTISSVLLQSFSDFEYIIVDGGSSDGSKEYIESKQEYINQWVSEKDHGVYNAMNKAIRMAQGEYCIFMNSGDHFFSSQSLELRLLRGRNHYHRLQTGFTLPSTTEHVVPIYQR